MLALILVACGGNKAEGPSAKKSTTSTTPTTTTTTVLTASDVQFVAMVRVDSGVLGLVGQLSQSDSFSGSDSEIVEIGRAVCDDIADDPSGRTPEAVIGSWQIDNPNDSNAKLGQLAVNFYCPEFGPIVESRRPAPTTAPPAPTTPRPAPTTAPAPVSELRGTIKLEPSTNRRSVYDDGTVGADNPTCVADVGDVQVGTSVTAYDGAGGILGTGQIASSQWVDLVENYSGPIGGTPGITYTWGKCLLSFSISDLPSVDFYSVEVGRRGRTNFSRSDLDAQGWNVQLTLV